MLSTTKKYFLLFACMLSLAAEAQFSISSSAFPPGGNIPEKYTAFNGNNVNPPLSWNNKPAGTKSFLLVMLDRTFCNTRPDSICRSHWVVKDIPAAIGSLQEGTSSTGPIPAGALLGKNDNAIHGIKEYIGPFPDSTTIHLYEFKLYALSVSSLNCVEPFYNICLQRALAGNVLATASVMGYYLPRPFDPLPVRFVNVEAACRNGRATCSWSTATESNNAKDFEIQKSTDGSRFYPVGTVLCRPGSSTLQQYSFTDSTNTIAAFYRIRQSDLDGKFMYSDVVAARCDGQAKLLLAVTPNPTVDKFVINFSNPQKKQLKMVVYDVSGKIVATFQSMQPNGSVVILEKAAPGMYLLKASFGQGGQQFTEKLIKTR
jgi:Raf kinase inhibitor-like YbhB/YbcL family protein